MIKEFLLSAALTVGFSACASTDSHNQQDREDVAATPLALYTPNPDVPDAVELCGVTLNLDRTDLYERLDRELTAMTYTHGNTLLTIKRANKLFPEMAPILKENGVPEDMLYLAAIESYLDNRAVSPAKAAGVWQFMPATAKDYGLEVNDYVDERYNLEKATAAACRMLKENYRKYGDWPTVAAAYNGGPARISKEIAAQKEKGALDLYLVTETSRYPFRIMAMKMIMENPRHYGFTLKASQLYQPVLYDRITVDTPVEDWADWAKRHGISYAQLREANPWIRAMSLPNKSGKAYTVRVPRKESLSRSTNSGSVYNPAWVAR